MSDSKTDDLSISSGKAVSVTTGTRLHFGLLSTTAPFGGVGVMLDRPQTEIRIQPASRFRCADDVCDRVLPIAQRVRQLADLDELPKCDVQVIERAAPHCGLGSGTQLAMAIAEGLCRFCGTHPGNDQLAVQIAERGKRSAVGAHGYFLGGMIYEAAEQPCDLNACQSRQSIPDPWCVGLYRPSQTSPQVSGQLERNHFRSLGKTSATERQQLVQIVTTEIIPAANEQRFSDFADAVQRYNYQAGLLFKEVQGGPYNGKQVGELIEGLLQRGAVGVGQSSWGPTVFAWFENADQATAFERNLPATIKKMAIAKPLNRPRKLR